MMVKYHVRIFLQHFNSFKPKAYVAYLLIIDDNSKLHVVDPEPMSKIEAELASRLDTMLE